MPWFSASAWESTLVNIHKMAFPYSQMILLLLNYPSTSGSTPKSLPLDAILERAKAAKQCLEEESKTSATLKHQVKQGPLKKSKKQRDE